MTELSLTILDVASNSIEAGASLVEIDLVADTQSDWLTMTIKDNGRGMTKQQIEQSTSPFFTSRTTRRIGMGLPLLKMMCEDTGGNLSIVPAAESGLVVEAKMGLSSVDRPPLGDIGSTMIGLMLKEKTVDIVLRCNINALSYVFDSREIRMALGEFMFEAESLLYIKDMINENIESINGGLIL